MWEVVATNKNGKVRTKIVNHWKHGMRLAGRAMDMGWRVSIVPVYVDFYIADEQGSLRKVVCRLTPKIAACYAIRWSKMDRERGSFVWPHGVPIPDKQPETPKFFRFWVSPKPIKQLGKCCTDVLQPSNCNIRFVRIYWCYRFLTHIDT